MEKFDIMAVVVIFAFCAIAAGGWVANIVKLAGMCCELSGWLVLRAVGVAAVPLGSVLGFL